MKNAGNSYCVYKHTTPNGKVYIGITSKNPLIRWNGGYGYINQPYFWNAIVKYGWQNIRHEILYTELTLNEAYEHERRLIAEYESTDTAKGYNISHGGAGAGCGSKRSDATKEKISKANTMRWANMEAHNREQNAERCRHMFEGHKHSVQSKEKDMLNNPRRKEVVQLTVHGEVIAKYNSIREAERKNNLKHPSVYYCVIGKTRTAGGFVWKYNDAGK